MGNSWKEDLCFENLPTTAAGNDGEDPDYGRKTSPGQPQHPGRRNLCCGEGRPGISTVFSPWKVQSRSRMDSVKSGLQPVEAAPKNSKRPVGNGIDCSEKFSTRIVIF